ncbi:hypothetical protein C0995_011661 [Termitomyces sp. Mi166|nr:hypothetical protein C0995_011661 [Termitomyces sp. Mi166\
MKWGGTTNFSWFGPSNTTGNGNGQALTAFSTMGGRFEVPDLNMENLDEVAEMLEQHATQGPLAPGTSDEIRLYVCTHGARDCRCGDMGSAVFRALQEGVARLVKEDPFGVASRIKVGEVGHVGGHQFNTPRTCLYTLMANGIVVSPSVYRPSVLKSIRLGMLKPGDIPTVLGRILDSPVRPYSAEDAPILPSHWRGRMGLPKDGQAQLFESLYPDSLPSSID